MPRGGTACLGNRQFGMARFRLEYAHLQRSQSGRRASHHSSDSGDRLLPERSRHCVFRRRSRLSLLGARPSGVRVKLRRAQRAPFDKCEQGRYRECAVPLSFQPGSMLHEWSL